MTKTCRYIILVCILILCLAIPMSAENDELKGLGFGVGLGFRWNVLKPALVDEAVVDDNGIVRVNKRVNTNAGLVLEMHHFIQQKGSFGHGPFVAVQSGTDQVISAAGGGWMFGWRLKAMENKAFGIGVGYAGLPSAKVLGSEFVEGQHAPKGSDGKPLAIRYQQRDKGSVMFVLSFVFN